MAPQREWFEKDYYKVLGVSEKATPKEITRAYRKLARELHPDANPDDASAEERFKEVAAAYDVVGDEAKRQELYDAVQKKVVDEAIELYLWSRLEGVPHRKAVLGYQFCPVMGSHPWWYGISLAVS